MIHLEKAFTHLAMPTGMIWLLAIALTLAAWRRRQRFLTTGLAALTVGLTLSGNTWVASALMNHLERDYRDINVWDEGPFDAVVVLGGGTNETPGGEPQLNWPGDRVMLGARLLLQGRAEMLVCTGSRAEGLTGDRRDASEDTFLLLQSLNVSDSQIVQLQGRNTSEEMGHLSALLQERPWKNVGLITSAWHMRRALRLADNAGLALTPLPANFESRSDPWSPVFIIPYAEHQLRIWWACKELLAGIVGR